MLDIRKAEIRNNSLYIRRAYLIIVVVAITLLCLGFWGTPKLESVSNTSQDKRPEFILGILTTGITSFGGFAFILNALIAQERLKEERKQFKLQLHEERKRESRVQAISETRLVAERFSKAIDQLGDSRVTVRIGGIYSLGHIAEENTVTTIPGMNAPNNLPFEATGELKIPQLLEPLAIPKEGYYRVILETLAAFLREQPAVEEPQDEDEGKQLKEQRIRLLFRPDLQAALTVVVRLNETRNLDETDST
ncbi:MAG: hypothetical protein F6K42_25590 [Leptolyngbya sp. SIO1D8]|nr:hypothetical protein [Leptolyngbya sp. SIO1D8]